MKTEGRPEKTGIRTEKTIAGRKYFTIATAASYLGVCKNTVRVYTKREGLSYLKFGQELFFQKEWLTVFINEKTKIQKYDESLVKKYNEEKMKKMEATAK